MTETEPEIKDAATETAEVDKAVQTLVDELLALQKEKQTEAGLPEGFVFIDFWPKDFFDILRSAVKELPESSWDDFLNKIALKCCYEIPDPAAADRFFPGIPRISEGYSQALPGAIKDLIEFHKKTGQLRDDMERDVHTIIERFNITADRIIAEGKKNSN